MKQRGIFLLFSPKLNKLCAAVLMALVLMLGNVTSVSAAGAQYNGELQMFGDVRNLGVNMYVSYLPDADENTEYIQMNYKGSGGSSIGIATQKGYGYDGRLEVYATFTRSNDVVTSDAAEQSLEYFISDVNAPEGVNISAHIVGRYHNYIKVKYLIEFDNYVAKASNVLISYTDNFSQDIAFTATENSATLGNLGNLFYTLECTASDWAGDLLEYSVLTEMSGAEWQNLAQNQEIIETLEENNLSIMDTIKAGVKSITDSISTYITKLNNDVNGWFDTLLLHIDQNDDAALEQDKQIADQQAAQSSEQHDELVNGYQKDTELDNANTNFDEVYDVTLNVENEFVGACFESSYGFVDNFTNLDIFQSIGSSILFVSTWFTNFWNIGGVFTSGINLCFVLSIAFFVLRLKR